jgi:hypothetical protein
MKSLFFKELAVGCCAVSLALFPMSAMAHHHGGGGIGWGGAAAIGAGVALGAIMLSQPYQQQQYYGPEPVYYGPPEEVEYSECEWVRGHHNRYGNWIPAHQECW